MSTAESFSLGEEAGDDGSFKRQESRFREWVSGEPDAKYPLEAGRYHLYASWACPWAHRSVIARMLMGLEDAIGLSAMDPIRDSKGWRFSGGEYTDGAGDKEFLQEAYEATEPGYDDRPSTPVLWDTEREEIVSNESADVLRMLHTVFRPLAGHPVDLYPEEHREGIDELNERLYDDVNNAVYKAGFSTDQEVYESEVTGLFRALDEMDERLADRRYLFGSEPVETDWRLFPTLLRFDAVYNIHFKCSIRKLVEYENLWPYARDLYQQPGIAETVRWSDIRRHYFCTHPDVNPSGLVAMAPAEDWTEPHGRD